MFVRSLDEYAVGMLRTHYHLTLNDSALGKDDDAETTTLDGNDVNTHDTQPLAINEKLTLTLEHTRNIHTQTHTSRFPVDRAIMRSV